MSNVKCLPRGSEATSTELVVNFSVGCVFCLWYNIRMLEEKESSSAPASVKATAGENATADEQEKVFRRQLLRIFEKLAPALKEAILSEETANVIWNISQRHDLENRVSVLARYIGLTLMGLLPLEEFKQTIKQELELEDEKTEKVFHDVNRYIFAGVKENLADLYESDITLPIGKFPQRKEMVSEEKPRKKDTYRESVEE